MRRIGFSRSILLLPLTMSRPQICNRCLRLKVRATSVICVNLTGWKSHCDAQSDCPIHSLRVVASLNSSDANPEETWNPQNGGTLPKMHGSPQSIEILSVDILMSRAAEMRRPHPQRLPSLWRETGALKQVEEDWFQCFRRSIRHYDPLVTNRRIHSQAYSLRKTYGGEVTKVRRWGKERLMQEMRLEDEKKPRCAK